MGWNNFPKVGLTLLASYLTFVGSCVLCPCTVYLLDATTPPPSSLFFPECEDGLPLRFLCVSILNVAIRPPALVLLANQSQFSW